MTELESDARRSSLRYWLLGLNLVAVSAPAVAHASGGGDIAVGVVAGCCGNMLGHAIQHAVTPKKKTTKVKYNYVSPGRAKTLQGRCLINEVATDCWTLAVKLERSAKDEATKRRALVYYSKACSIGPGTSPCDHADRLADELGCRDAYDCGGFHVDKEVTELDVNATRSAFADAMDRVALECKNDEPTVKSVRVSVRFAPSGQALVTTLDPLLTDSLIGECLHHAFGDISVPRFSDEATTASLQVSLAEVPSAFQLVHAQP